MQKSGGKERRKGEGSENRYEDHLKEDEGGRSEGRERERANA